MEIEIGHKFSRLTVISAADRRNYFVCKCDCGTIKEVRKDHLIGGKTLSCGCLKDEAASRRASVMHKANTKHGMSKSPVYGIWHGMRQRCLNPKNPFFSYYGGRGITVCERWTNFENFLADMGIPGESMTIDRIDNNAGYSPENCRWTTRTEQQNNRNVCRFITWQGETKTIKEWSRATGIHNNTLTDRIDNGLPLSEVFSPEKRLDISGFSLGAKASSIARKARTHCKNGHEYTPENTHFGKKQRFCRACNRNKEAARRLAKSGPPS